MTGVERSQGIQTWSLEPRDPLVFGDGGPVAAFAPRTAFTLPPQATVAGLVRTAILEATGDISDLAARAALEVRLRGPWMVDQGPDAPEPGRLWVPAPADVAVSDAELLRPRLIRPADDEGVNWPPDAPPAVVHLPARSEANGRSAGGAKTEPPPFPLWPLGAVIAWGLGEGAASLPEEWHLLAAGGLHPITREPRVHVAIDPERQTALPEALFSSGGLRVADGFRFVVEVAASAAGGPAPPAPSGLRILGGESRTVACASSSEALFPGFEVYRERVERFVGAARAPLGLRVQLLTPGDFGGWLPRWPAAVAVPVLAVAMNRHQAVSGWNLRGQRPRAVRRLAPAGTVYYLGPFAEPGALLDTWRSLWGVSLCEGLPGDPATFLAPPAHDGYGIALPLPCVLPWEEP